MDHTGVDFMQPCKVAYVLFKFPHLTETFVAQEIDAVRRSGTPVKIFSLLPPDPGPVHALSKELARRVEYAPGLLSWRLWWANLYFLLRSPRRFSSLFVELLREPCPVPDFRLKRIAVFFKAVALARRMQGTSVRLVHTHFAWLPGAAARVIAELLNLAYTVTTHAYDIYSIENDLLCFTIRSATHIVTISDYNKGEMLERCPGLDADRISVIRCGVDIDTFKPAPKEADERLVIVSVGSLIEKKGHAYLIRACRQLVDRDVDFECTIIGRGRDEPQLRQLIAENGLGDRVTLAGAKEQSAVLETYRNSDVFVLACVVEKSGRGRDGIPVALMEAMAMQLPVVSTRVSGIPELVRHEETGLLVPPRDEAALADAIERLSRDPELRRRLAERGRERVIEEFEIQKNAGRLVDLFEALIQEREQ